MPREYPRPVGDVDPRALKRLERDHVRHVDAQRVVLKATLAQLVRYPLPEPSGMPVSMGMAPRIGATPARKFSSGSHGANS